MSDRDFSYAPNKSNSRYIYWDRYNSGLETHFYTHDEIFRTYGKPKRKFGVLIESPAIVPQIYENVLNNKDYVEKNFDAIFTYDVRILSTIKNAVSTGGYVPIELPFKSYRFTIAIENLVSPFYFTEKLLNCFAAQTIPIYIGATEAGKFFNPDGIIQMRVEDFDRLEEILAKCTPEEYERRLPAVLDNYRRVQIFINQTRMDDIYIEYLK